WATVSVGEEEGGAGQEWQACPSSSPGRGAILDILSLSVVVVELPPPSPRLRVGGRPSPTAVAESQRGEPRSRAFGTGARVAGSISSGPVLLPLVSVGEEEGGAGQEWQACPSSSPGRGAILDILSLSVVVESSPVGGPLPPPSPSDDLRPPPPTAVAES
ncbi:hypothetical protein EDB84DRAFT_1561081, partial [Lactarius hengduanensis]